MSEFGAPSYIEGAAPVDDSVDYPHASQDAGGRLHAVWHSLHDGNRLRYTRSDDGGATFGAAANLAAREFFFEPLVEAAPDGSGFAVWAGNGVSPIRVVRIDPQPEAGSPAGRDTTAPLLTMFKASDRTLRPGQRARFEFVTSEAGIARLRLLKRTTGVKLLRAGRLTCLQRTGRLLRELRRSVRAATGTRATGACSSAGAAHCT
jgi:hypothetical protein